MQPKDPNQRRFVRTPLRASVTLSHPETGVLRLHTCDISDGGAYILAEGHRLPEPGEIVEVQVQGLPGGDAPVVKMRVVRMDPEGVGLEFIAPDDDQQ